MTKCKECERELLLDGTKPYVYVSFINPKSFPPEKGVCYHIDCFYHMLIKSKFSEEIELLIILREVNQDKIEWSKCEKCGEEVDVVSNETIHVLANMEYGQRLNAVFHKYCFFRILSKKSSLFHDLNRSNDPFIFH